MPKANKQLQLFRKKIKFLLSTYSQRMELFIEEEVLAGEHASDIKQVREDPKSTWNIEKGNLNKDIKREVAGLINRIHSEIYTGGI